MWSSEEEVEQSDSESDSDSDAESRSSSRVGADETDRPKRSRRKPMTEAEKEVYNAELPEELGQSITS